MNVTDQILIIYAGNTGALDQVDRRKVSLWEEQFLTYIKDRVPELRQKLEKEKEITPEIEKMLNKAIEDFKGYFKG